jgi:hypothetical protein
VVHHTLKREAKVLNPFEPYRIVHVNEVLNVVVVALEVGEPDGTLLDEGSFDIVESVGGEEPNDTLTGYALQINLGHHAKHPDGIIIRHNGESIGVRGVQGFVALEGSSVSTHGVALALIRYTEPFDFNGCHVFEASGLSPCLKSSTP